MVANCYNTQFPPSGQMTYVFLRNTLIQKLMNYGYSVLPVNQDLKEKNKGVISP
jgi:hypothetical protein